MILDTNALAAFADGDHRLRALIEQEIDILIPAVVLGEYLYGIRQSRHQLKYEAWLRANPGALLIGEVGADTASHYADIRAELKTAGRPIPTNDLWIAAFAREHRCTVVTTDQHCGFVHGFTGGRVVSPTPRTPPDC